MKIFTQQNIDNNYIVDQMSQGLQKKASTVINDRDLAKEKLIEAAEIYKNIGDKSKFNKISSLVNKISSQDFSDTKNKVIQLEETIDKLSNFDVDNYIYAEQYLKTAYAKIKETFMCDDVFEKISELKDLKSYSDADKNAIDKSLKLANATLKILF